METNAHNRLLAGTQLFKHAVADINHKLTDAARQAATLGSLAGSTDEQAQAKKLEELIDEARHYAFKIR